MTTDFKCAEIVLCYCSDYFSLAVAWRFWILLLHSLIFFCFFTKFWFCLAGGECTAHSQFHLRCGYHNFAAFICGDAASGGHGKLICLFHPCHFSCNVKELWQTWPRSVQGFHQSYPGVCNGCRDIPDCVFLYGSFASVLEVNKTLLFFLFFVLEERQVLLCWRTNTRLFTFLFLPEDLTA